MSDVSLTAMVPPPPPDEAPFGWTLVAEGVLRADQLRAALHAQQEMRAHGENLCLCRVLVHERILTTEQVRQFRRVVDRRVLNCPTRSKYQDVKDWDLGREIFCPMCSLTRLPASTEEAIDSSDPHLALLLVDPQDQAGKPFGRYRLLDELGRGGMGVVWKAWDMQLRRVVALKQVHMGGEADAGRIERFMREAQLAAKLNHPHIVAVYDVGEYEGQRYFTTKYVHGTSLEQAMQKPVPVKQALAWVKAIAEALGYAHEQGVVHRDIKPANILIDEKGQPCVTDFGLAKEVEESGSGGGRNLTRSGALLGTPRYMSPEHASGRNDRLGPAADQFSLGAVLYELLTGPPPFDGETLRDLLNAITEADPSRPTCLNPRLHNDVETICLKTLEKDPARRYASMADLATDLGRVLEGEPIRARRIPAAARLWRKAVRNRRIAIPSAVVVVLAIVFLVVAARQRTQALRASNLEKAEVSEALELLEVGREGVDAASRYLYDPDASYDELVLKVKVGQAKIYEALQKAPNLEVAYFLLGKCWDLRGEDQKAEGCWRRAVELHPEYGHAHYELGRLLMMRSSFLTLASSREQRDANRAEAGRLADEAGAELDAAVSGMGFDDPLARMVAEVLKANTKGDKATVRRLAERGSRSSRGSSAGRTSTGSPESAPSRRRIGSSPSPMPSRSGRNT